MNQMGPPEVPTLVAVGDDDRLDRLRFRLWQVMVTLVTVLATAWCFTVGPVLGIIALMVAKHVLVAVLIVGMDYEALRRPGRRSG